jgi:hypothetical protein
MQVSMVHQLQHIPFVQHLSDAAGALMAGVPVTWTVSGTTGAAIHFNWSKTRTIFICS